MSEEGIPYLCKKKGIFCIAKNRFNVIAYIFGGELLYITL